MPKTLEGRNTTVRIVDHATIAGSANEIERGTGTQAIERAAHLLRILGASRAAGCSLSDVVRDSMLSKPTVRRLLVGMIRAGLVEQDDRDRRYYLGSEAFVLGSIAALRYHIGAVALESLQRLAQFSGDTIFLSVMRGSDSVCLHREEGHFPIRTHALNVGDRHPLGVGAGSLAMLAALPDHDVERFLAINAQRVERTYAPAFDSAILRELVREARDLGYAFNPGLLVPGSLGIAVPIVDDAGAIAGALSIAAIESRMGEARRRHLAQALAAESETIATRLAELRGDTRDHRSSGLKGNR